MSRCVEASSHQSFAKHFEGSLIPCHVLLQQWEFCVAFNGHVAREMMQMIMVSRVTLALDYDEL